MPRRKSQLWNHFTKIGDKQARCDYCSKIISVSCGSMGNLMRHIRVKHSTVSIFINVPKNNMSSLSDDQSETCLVTQETVDEDNMANMDVNSNLNQPSTSDQNNQMEQCEESSQKYMLMMDQIAPTETPQSPPEELPMPPPGKQWCEEVGGMDEFELLGRAWGSKLRRLSPPTRRQAERLVHEVFFLADMGELSGQSRVVAGTRVKLIKLSSQ